MRSSSRIGVLAGLGTASLAAGMLANAGAQAVQLGNPTDNEPLPKPMPRPRAMRKLSIPNAPRGNANATGTVARARRNAAKKRRVKAHRARSRG